MSWTYSFYHPVELPLTPSALSEETVHNFSDASAVRSALSACLPHLAWMTDPGNALARAEVIEDGEHYEFAIRIYDDGTAPSEGAPTLMVSMHCSGRIDSAPFAQRLCDELGWICFDDRAYLFQPHQPAVPGGGGQ